MSEATVLLAAVEQGDSKAAAELLDLVYDELRHLASAKMAQVLKGVFGFTAFLCFNVAMPGASFR